MCHTHCCCCYWPPVREVCTNDEVVDFQSRTLTTMELGSITYCYVAYLLYPSYPLLLLSDVPPASSQFDDDVSHLWIYCMVESATSSIPHQFLLRRRTVISHNYTWPPSIKRTWWAVRQRPIQDSTSLQVSRAYLVLRFFSSRLSSLLVLSIRGGEAKNEAVGIGHNEIYSVNCVRISCSSGKLMVLGFPKFLMKGFHSKFFFTWCIPFRW